MSTILDALKKSERERTVLRGLGFSDAGWRPTRDIDWLRWAVIGGIVAIVLVGVTVFILRMSVVQIRPSAAPVAQSSGPAMEVANSNVPVVPPAESITTMPAVTSPALADIAAAVPSPTTRPSVPAKAEFLHALPTEFQKAIPPMTVNIHVYASEESGRILYINNQQYRGGDEIPGGIRVEEIIPEGVLLQFQGQRFKLARPS